MTGLRVHNRTVILLTEIVLRIGWISDANISVYLIEKGRYEKVIN